MSKISVKGDDQHPLYKWLTSKSDNGLENSKVSWNFQKYMIEQGVDANGSGFIRSAEAYSPIISCQLIT